jgi:hypothetical protein
VNQNTQISRLIEKNEDETGYLLNRFYIDQKIKSHTIPGDTDELLTLETPEASK